MQLPKKIFITGTDTGIGKTLVSAIITAGKQGYYWKPVQSGTDEGTDTDWVKKFTKLPESHFLDEAYIMKKPLSPHESSSLEGIEIELSQIKMPDENISPLVIEGAGGVMVPLSKNFLVIDLIKQLETPVIIVARSGLGTINHTLLTVMALKNANIEITGIVMNGVKNTSNRNAIEKIGKVPVIAEIEPLSDINHEKLIEIFQKNFVQEL